MVINIIWCVKIYNPKLKTKTDYPDCFNLKGEFEYSSHPIEKGVDVESAHVPDHEVHGGSHMRKRSTL